MIKQLKKRGKSKKKNKGFIVKICWINNDNKNYSGRKI